MLQTTMKKSVILTGFMGSGKSTIGARLAQVLNYKFVDTDAMIVKRDGRSISQIFLEDGEDKFRHWESVISQELADRERLVIATGGRLMLDENNASVLGRNAHIFCLTAEADEIIKRLQRNSEQRPLLNVSNPTERIRILLEQRADKYARFPQINTSGKTIEEIVKEIIRCISMI